ncbi:MULTISPECIES: MgtC/SapB family protein [unclassified Luteimonas]|uniref:MgtC/SapB family protein n=1 Tax=unclassified Luteimonas TaxID=2629088 RepID=UPI0016213C27|nr:MgtC/SapB family protein [Luteimonas sp. RC10]MBB3343744.1 putative Mg2+ transporter-C (MgtC) family protein [Luteimonas sp. RC10]
MSVLDQVLDAVARELALPDPDTLTTIVVRVLVAALLGGMVGWEREHKGRAAGLKTHILVSIGSALFVLAPLLSDIDGAEVTRVMQGIVSGIGFLGAGAILKLDKGERIEGLTTAAGVWMTAAIGMAAGMGQEMVALATTLVALLVVGALPRLQRPRAGAGRRNVDMAGRDS